MAGIDKIYGTTEEYDIFYAWCEEELPEATNFFYPRDGYENDLDRPITNLPTHIDYILMFHCPLEFVQKGLNSNIHHITLRMNRSARFFLTYTGPIMS